MPICDPASCHKSKYRSSFQRRFYCPGSCHPVRVVLANSNLRHSWLSASTLELRQRRTASGRSSSEATADPRMRGLAHTEWHPAPLRLTCKPRLMVHMDRRRWVVWDHRHHAGPKALVLPGAHHSMSVRLRAKDLPTHPDKNCL